MRVKKLLPISKCQECFHCKTKLTKGFGYALDYECHYHVPPKMIASYVEWDSEAPQTGIFPKFCPLTTQRSKKEVK